MKQAHKFILIISMILSLAVFTPLIKTGNAAVPRTLNVQGRLDENGFLADGNYEMTFKIYRNQTGGNALFVETHSGTVKATNGYFSTILGDLNSLNLDFNEQYWLGITIENDSEASPRIALNASPYALKAGGLVLDENLNLDNGTLFADISNNKIGIGTTAPNAELDVQGDINATGNISAGAFFGDGSNLIGINSSANDTNWVTEGKDFRELANLWAFFPSKTIGDANISSVSWSKIINAPVIPVLNVPWQDANIADDITLTNLTQITNRSYNDLQDKPSIPAGGICDNNSNCNLTGTINTTSNAVISANLNVDSGTLFVDSTDNNVGIGDLTPESKLTVAGTIESTSGGMKFPDGTIQTTAASSGGTLECNVVTAVDTHETSWDDCTASAQCAAGYIIMWGQKYSSGSFDPNCEIDPEGCYASSTSREIGWCDIGTNNACSATRAAVNAKCSVEIRLHCCRVT